VFFHLLFSSLFSRQCVNTKKRKSGLLWSYTPTSRRERQELFFCVCRRADDVNAFNAPQASIDSLTSFHGLSFLFGWALSCRPPRCLIQLRTVPPLIAFW
jgi:hypothetical protein